VVKAYKQWENSVVKITVLGANNAVVSSGCGILWKKGCIITNAHVVVHSRYRFAAFGKQELRLLGIDRYHDIAVLAFNVDTTAIPPMIPVSTNLNSGINAGRKDGATDAVQAGQTVLCIYYPYNFPISLTVGVVSGINREIQLRGIDKPPLYDLIQFDSAILPGASGSPLVNTAGQLVGMTVAMGKSNSMGKGIGLAIPYRVLERTSKHIIEFNRPPPIPYIPYEAQNLSIRMMDGVKVGGMVDVWRALHREYKVGELQLFNNKVLVPV